MPAKITAPRWSALMIALSVALLALGFAPSARATTTYNELWVASTSTATASAPGTSCAAPGYISNSETGVISAISDAAAGATIHLCSGIYTFNTTADIGQANLSIVGAGPTTTYVANFRTVAFLHSSENLSVSGITFTGGYSDAVEGGAVIAEGTLTVNNSHFNTNYSEKGGGAIAAGVAVIVDNSTFYNNSTTDQGGAIASYGTVTVTNSVFTANQSIADTQCIGGGGAIAAADDVHVTGSRFTNNSAVLTTNAACGIVDIYGGGDFGSAYGGKGGAIASLGYVWATDTVFTSNRATLAGGAVAELTPSAPTVGADVGGTYTRASFTDNEASGLGGGAVLVHGITTIASSSFTNNRTGLYGGSAVYSDGALNVSRSTFSKNTNDEAVNRCEGPCGPGAIFGGTVNVTTSVFNANTGGGFGGAIGAATVRVTYSVFTKNKSFWTGGAITAFDLVVKHSQFTGNSVSNPYYSEDSAHGGGALFVCNTLDVDYSRFTGNSVKSANPAAQFYGAGGAIGGYGRTAVISHTWFVKNTASGRGGAVNLGTGTGGPESTMAVTLTRNRFNYNVAGSYGGAVELGGETAAALAASKYNSFVGNRAGAGGSIMSVFVAGGITQANLDSFAKKNPSKGNRGPGKGLLLLPNVL
jgi:predicted outer membrane repeat protein